MGEKVADRGGEVIGSPFARSLADVAMLAMGFTPGQESEQWYTIPLAMEGIDDAGLKALGFMLGDPDPGDPLFRPATLPPGWKKEPTEHPMWSRIVDEEGEKRFFVFYKAAFYDRKAYMRPA